MKSGRGRCAWKVLGAKRKVRTDFWLERAGHRGEKMEECHIPWVSREKMNLLMMTMMMTTRMMMVPKTNRHDD